MPKERFEVIVGTRFGEGNRERAIADAARYLAYADHTDTFGYHADVPDVEVYGGGDQQYGIGFTFTAPIVNDTELKRFMDEMANLSRVETVERVGVV